MMPQLSRETSLRVTQRREIAEVQTGVGAHHSAMIVTLSKIWAQLVAWDLGKYAGAVRDQQLVRLVS